MTLTCVTKEQAAARYDECRDELKAIAAELQQLAALPEKASEALFNSLESDAKALEAEMVALKTEFPGMWRKTSPNATGSRSSRGSSAAPSANHYVKLHGLDGQKLDDGGFKSLGEFLSAVGSGMLDARIVNLRAAASGSQFSAGGVMVPERFLAETLHPAGENELIMPRARVYPMDAGTLQVSTLDNLVNTDGEMYGGFSAQWIPEGGTFNEQTPETSAVTFNRKKLGLFTLSSTELVSDSDYERELVPALQAAIQEFRDYAFFAGDGVGKPKGILNDVAMLTVAKETNQPADTILTANLDKMYSRIHPRLIRNCRWYVNPTCIPALFGLTRTVGVAGAPIPVLNESSGTFSMFGLAVELTSKLPVLGDSGDVLLADVSQYGIGASRGVAIARSTDFKFQTGQIAWRAEWRGDGQGLWRAPFTPRNGSTLSWCVKLAERA